MPNPKPKPTEYLEVSGPCKHKLSTKVITNSDPVEKWKKQKLASKKQGTKPAPIKKRNTTKAIAKLGPQQWGPSIEEIEDESDHNTSVPPRNPRHILEAADRSDDDVDITPPQKSTTSTKKPVIMKQRPSVEVEQDNDELDHHTSVPPLNPQHILEATNWSDNDSEEDPAPSGNEKADSEAAEGSNKAELGMYVAWLLKTLVN